MQKCTLYIVQLPYDQIVLLTLECFSNLLNFLFLDCSLGGACIAEWYHINSEHWYTVPRGRELAPK